MRQKLILVLFFLSVNSLLIAHDSKFRLDVLYFHATIRCEGCLTIENHTYNIVKTKYQKELEDSLITIKSIDFLDEQNEHYQQDYKFDSQTLILSKKVNGKEIKWKKLTKIWDYYHDFSKFEKYITEEINKFLKVKLKGKK